MIRYGGKRGPWRKDLLAPRKTVMEVRRKRGRIETTKNKTYAKMRYTLGINGITRIEDIVRMYSRIRRS